VRVNDESLWCCADKVEGIAGDQSEFRAIVDVKHLHIFGGDDLEGVHDVLGGSTFFGRNDPHTLLNLCELPEVLVAMAGNRSIAESAKPGRAVQVACSSLKIEKGAAGKNGNVDLQ
jgi:hypothetical protein